ncbi:MULTISPECIES: hypothetical protein [Xanthomonas]|uniref:Lipoprotein n=1 Tax=Xanthomonas rydalmerensis TaxID=3046274 RepID=A0ABZ0JT68_9XANT|nr:MULTISPECIES: hypothetical protein [unclassified Xanthomonas]MBB5943082.1 hypothetical protein [Xanthomonas sp. 3307]MXV06417.1 hypothetical protein [Xanthomonas sp. LMG 9002]WOS42307.1 hypothetical protein QN243_07670 [Xanthomonas sp. DM-2023]WOS46494.1 hypothetical protein QN242_07670 [Xanthomonas sp. DM-2023]WOS50673.1 hypothetical protein QN240_07670 [Xanthomonas sp. DM-2023]
MPLPYRFGLAASLLLASHLAHAAALPTDVLRQVPSGYQPLAQLQADLDGDGRADYLVALQQRGEAQRDPAPARPLLIFVQLADGHYRLAARNDHVILKRDQGGQCDPFDPDEDPFAAKGRYFTVQNGVSCGQHWTDFITFRYDPQRKQWLFHKRIQQRWEMNPNPTPDAEALVKDGDKVQSADPKHPVGFADYVPR